MAKQSISPQTILTTINNGVIKPIYFLMGEESYYIDLITNTLIGKILDETQKDFDLSEVYGKDVTMNEVIMLARQYPMIASRKVVCVKEAQDIKDIDHLSSYIQKPMPTTILIVNYKNGTLDKRKKLYTDLEAGGVVLESKKLYDNEIPGWIEQYVTGRGFSIDHKSSNLLADFIGSDLSRIIGETDKLMLTIPAGEKRITPELIERNIGISKEYNDFELLNAIARKDILKANRISQNFSMNPKKNPLTKSIAVLSNFFINLMYYHYLTDKTQAKVAAELGVPYGIAKEYELAARNYNGFKTMQIIRTLRTFDAMSKGVDSRGAGDGEFLKELLFRIFH
ncbi:MAG: DNA polymerase III subunit delta [Bacteroidota bacterium]|nr:DNA polymerase III subunit delta [Bacteroidota bacterium]